MIHRWNGHSNGFILSNCRCRKEEGRLYTTVIASSLSTEFWWRYPKIGFEEACANISKAAGRTIHSLPTESKLSRPKQLVSRSIAMLGQPVWHHFLFLNRNVQMTVATVITQTILAKLEGCVGGTRFREGLSSPHWKQQVLLRKRAIFRSRAGILFRKRYVRCGGRMSFRGRAKGDFFFSQLYRFFEEPVPPHRTPVVTVISHFFRYSHAFESRGQFNACMCSRKSFLEDALRPAASRAKARVCDRSFSTTGRR